MDDTSTFRPSSDKSLRKVQCAVCGQMLQPLTSPQEPRCVLYMCEPCGSHAVIINPLRNANAST